MNFEDERWIKLYTRDAPEFLAMTWQARGLFTLIMRKLDRAGFLACGRLGKRGVAVAIGAPWVEVQEFLEELLDDGCVAFDPSTGMLSVPNFTLAQDSRSSGKARQKASRELAIATVTHGLDPRGDRRTLARTSPETYTDRREQTRGDETSVDSDDASPETYASRQRVTPGDSGERSEEIRSEQNRTEKIPERERPRAILKCEAENPEPKQAKTAQLGVTIPDQPPSTVAGPENAERTNSATLAASEPQKPVLVQRGAKVADLGKGIDLDQPMPAWAMPRYETIRMVKGISLDVPLEWMGFVTHLARLREQGVVRPVCEAEWSSWLQKSDRFGGNSRTPPASAPAKPPKVVQREAKPSDASPELPIHPDRKSLRDLHMAVMQKAALRQTLGDVPVPAIELSGNPATAPAPSELQDAYRRLEAYEEALAEFEANREKEIDDRREMPPANDFFEPSDEAKAKCLEEFNAGIEARRIDWKAVEANGGQIPLSPEQRARQLEKAIGVPSIRADVERKGLTPQIVESAKDMVASFARLGGTPPEDIVAWSKETP